MNSAALSASRNLKALALSAIAIGISACGTSVYSPVAPESSDKATLEKAVLAMDKKDFETAKSSLKQLWANDKSNDITQLYANSILGAAGFDLYEIILRVLKSANGTNLKTANDILGALSNILNVEANKTQLDDLKLTLDVLGKAQNQKSTSLEFQKCLTVGIYALPIVNGISDSIDAIGKTLDGLPEKLDVSKTDNRTCGASQETIASIGQDLTDTISEIGEISRRISDITEVIQNCSTISSSTGNTTSSVNAITTKVTNIINQADKGCTIPSTGVLGSRFLPSCMTSFIEETARETAANDGVVTGCEIFINCSRGTCFSR